MLKFTKNKQNIWMIISFVLAIILLSVIVYAVVSNIKEAKVEKERELIQLGAQQGYEFAVSQIIEQASTCEPVSLFKDNLKMQLVDIECVSLQKS